MIKSLFICIILFIALFGGVFYTIGVPQKYSAITEILIVLYFFVSILYRSGKGLPYPHLWYVFIFFILINLSSLLINDVSFLRSLYSIRLLFRFYFFYLAITFTEFDENDFKKINLCLYVFLLLQLPIVAAKFMEYGISEKTMGGYAVHSGSMATTLPISFIFFLASFYFYYKPKKSYIFTSIGYIIFSIVAMKRAIFFLYPIQFLAIYYYIYIRGLGNSFTKKGFSLIIVVALISGISAAILRFNATLNPENEVGGSIDIGYALEFANEYNTNVNAYGKTTGRLSTTVNAIQKLFDSGIANILIGLGPGYTTRSLLDSENTSKKFQEDYDNLDIKYGLTSSIKIMLEFGFLGFMLYVLIPITFICICKKVFKMEKDRYWKAFASGSFWLSVSMLFFYLSYSPSSFWGDTMPVLYFYTMAVIYKRYNKLKNDYKHTAIQAYEVK